MISDEDLAQMDAAFAELMSAVNQWGRLRVILLRRTRKTIRWRGKRFNLPHYVPYSEI